MQRTFIVLVVLCLLHEDSWAQDRSHVDDGLLFYTTFDDVADVNLFGPDNDAGWLYTAESTQRDKVLMHNRLASVTIDDDGGKMGDCLKFAAKTKEVLFYPASPNLAPPKSNWSGTLSFWLKTDLKAAKDGPCYPLQLGDGDWNHGGFFVRLQGEGQSPLEFGAVSSDDDSSKVIRSPSDVSADHSSVVALQHSPFDNGDWKLITFTFEDVNPDDGGESVAKLYVDGKLVGQIERPLQIKWMDPEAVKAKPNAAVFLGVNFVGCVDDLRIYDRALSGERVKLLFEAAE